MPVIVFPLLAVSNLIKCGSVKMKMKMKSKKMTSPVKLKIIKRN